MQTIILNNLGDFSFADVYKLIMCTPDKDYTVILNRTDTAKDKNYELMYEFYAAAWIGRKLSKISRRFEYWTPHEYSQDPFSFQLCLDDKEPFADLIYEIISSYLFEKSYEKYNIFYDDATDHYVNALSQLEESYCWGLLSIASDFQLKFEEEL